MPTFWPVLADTKFGIAVGDSAAERPGLRAVGAFEHVTTSSTYANKTDRQFPH